MERFDRAAPFGAGLMHRTSVDRIRAVRLQAAGSCLRRKAKKSKNQKEKIRLSKQAQNISDSSIELQKQGDVASANAHQFKSTEPPNSIAKGDSQTVAVSKDTSTMNKLIIASKDTSAHPKETIIAILEPTEVINVQNIQKQEPEAKLKRESGDSVAIIIPLIAKKETIHESTKPFNENNGNPPTSTKQSNVDRKSVV